MQLNCIFLKIISMLEILDNLNFIYKPFVALEHPAGGPCFAAFKSPKSCEFPIVAIVIKSITLLNDGVTPPAKIPLVGDEQEPDK